MEEKSSNKLSSSEKRDLVIEAAMQAIPYVGAPLSVIYFGAKQEKRFKRIESFYAELAEEINEIRDQIASVDKQNKEALAAILEELNEKVETEPLEEKRQFFKNYFKNTLRKPITNDFDKRKYFLQTLADMSLLGCELLAFISSQPGAVLVGNIKKPGTDQYAIVGAIGRLKSYGFLMSFQGSFTIGGGQDNALQEQVQLSHFGKEFVDFCLKA
ncbi:hypothetical protein [Deferrisoma camini]|uniref:hypothetical protein n=1 Tax=Deferrisoma camini TaxID=1035120 RepID=UPI00146A54D3|nr:hypothetical protein [Deferrisoma camini]